MATKRKSLSKKTRFEVFKRDGFKCQYCGASAPDVILQVDHIDPISKDGADEMVNYITACQACNSGKSDRRLDDQTTLAKQRSQLQELNERREQLEMMLKWRTGIKEIKDIEVDEVCSAWKQHALGFHLNDKGRKEATSYVSKYGLLMVLDAVETAAGAYIKRDIDGEFATKESVELAWSKVGGILALKSLPDAERELHYVKGILRNRINYVPYDVVRYLKDALQAGVPVDDMKLEAKHARSWTGFKNWLYAAMEN